MINFLVQPVSEGGVGIDVNEKSTGGWTPLHYAASCGAEIVTKHLVQNLISIIMIAMIPLRFSLFIIRKFLSNHFLAFYWSDC